MEDGLIVNARIATMAGGRYAMIDDGALIARAGRIAWVGSMSAFDRERPAPGDDADFIDAHGALVTPGLVDCHTHLVYAGNRAQEFERRLQGATYEEIALEGGGILSTVRATRAATPAQLAAEAAGRIEALAAGGVTTVEIKSGYGLDLENEMKCLRVARALTGMRVVTTFLGAHALPPEFAGRADGYIDLVCGEMIPAVAREKLADAVDAFCEAIGFTPAQTQRVFEAARAHGLRVKLHAEQLSNLHGAALAARFGALSADHLEYADEAGVAAMANSGTVAVLLPGAFYFLRETRIPPVELLRKHRVPMAVATDCNPGTSPITSLPTVLGMACTFFRLTPEEALAGATCHAARALGLDDRGVLAAGNLADVVLWDAQEPAEISYSVGVPRARRV